MNHLLLPENAAGRDFALGDLHGMLAAFEDCLAAVDFDRTRDRVISVGDLGDRGPDSLACFALLDEPWFFACRGNHEELLLEVADGEDAGFWYQNGGDWAVAMDLTDLAATIRTLPFSITVTQTSGARVGICHAQVPCEDWATVEADGLTARQRYSMIWGRSVIQGRAPVHTRNVDLTIHGHTPIPDQKRLGNACFIDTGAVYGGPLTLLDIAAALERP